MLSDIQSSRKYLEPFLRFGTVSLGHTSKTELDYFHQKKDMRVSNQVPKQLKT